MPTRRPDVPAPPDAIRGDVEFRHLTFAYGDDVGAATTSRSRMPAGTTTAIVGATGSGKSTLLSLLPRLHDPPAGTVFVDGVRRARTCRSTCCAARIGFVPQEPFLFSATIADNIAFGEPARAGRAGWPRTDRSRRRRRRGSTRTWPTFPARLRHDRGRARHHAVGRPEAARRDRPRAGDRPADPGPRRRAVGRGYPHRGGDPAAACAA